MPENQQRYIFKESMIGMLISLLLSILFVFLIFDPQQPIPVLGMQGLLMDSIPQSFAITFMATLMPTLLTRIRLKKASIELVPGFTTRLPANLFVRSAMLALVVTLMALLAHYLLFSLLTADTLPFTSVLIFKACYGALLGALVARFSLIKALSSAP